MSILRKIFAVAVLLAATSGVCNRTALGKSPPPVPERYYTLWGTAYVDGVALTGSDTGYTISIQVNSEELASCTMGSSPMDWCVLMVPMSVGERQPGTAQAGDTAYIYINGVLITEAYLEPGHQPVALPASIGNPAETVKMSVYTQIAPSAIGDLSASSGAGDGEVDLTWTAPGNNGSLGTANGYIVKYSQNPITNQAQFDSASAFPQSWTPEPSGDAESHTLTGLTPGQVYYFAVEAVDSVPLQGAMSNSPVSAMAADHSPPYAIGHNPPPDSTAPIDTNISVEIKDDGVGVDQATIQMTVEGAPVAPVITTIAGGYSLVYDPPADFAYSQEVNVTLYADDLLSPPNQMGVPHSYSFLIGDNASPEASDLSISPSSPVTADNLVGSYSYSDTENDPEGATEIKWYKNGNEQTAWRDTLTVPSSATSRGQNWHFTVKPHDGFSYGGVQTSDPVVIGNTPPTADDLAVSPSEPLTGDNLEADYDYSDVDNDPEGVSEIRWYKDGSVQTGYNDQKIVSSTSTAKEEEWYFTIKPNDGATFGALQTSPAITIGNTRPVASDAVISPSSPLTGDDLVASYVYSDADGDEEFGSTIRWYKNGNIIQSAYNDQTIVPSSATNKGEDWHFTVRPDDDGMLPRGLYLTSPTVTIGNTPPVADAGGPYEVRSGVEIIFDGSGSSDADGDPLSYSWDLGDGSTGAGVGPAHTYPVDGVYIVNLIVSDGTVDSDASVTTAYMGPEPGGTQQTAIELVAGWNLISLPIEPENTSPPEVLFSIVGKYDSIWGYDAVSKEWLVYSVNAPPFMNGLSELMPGRGYWIKMNQPGILVFQGIAPVTAVLLRAGLNLVGYNSQAFSKSIEECTTTIVGKYKSIWTYNPYLDMWPRYVPGGAPSANNLQIMQIGKGYWIDAKEDCLWDIGP